MASPVAEVKDGKIVSHTNQNIHYYDGDLQYDHLKLVQRIKVCGVVMHLGFDVGVKHDG